MAAVVLGPSQRYAVRGNSEAMWIPLAAMPDGVLDTAAITAATAVKLTAALAAVTGFSQSQGDLPAGDWSSMQTPTVPGEVTTDASSMTFYLSKDGEDVREVLHTGDEGFVVIFDTGITADAKCDVYPSTVKYGTKVREDVARITVPFSIGVGVQENVTVPALA